MNVHENLQLSEPERCTWSEIAEEANELVDLHEKSSPTYFTSGSDVKRVRKVGKCKGKEKNQFHFHSREIYLSSRNANVDANQEPCEDIEMPAGQDFDQSIARDTCSEVFAVVQHEKARDDAQMPCAVAHDCNSEHSISALLGNLEKESGGTKLASKKLLLRSRKDRRFGFTSNKNMQMCNKFLDSDDYLELLANEISSSDEDEKTCQSSSVIQEKKEQKMLDLFNVFTAVPNATEWRTSNHASDYHVRLQHLLQSEKDIQTAFSKQMQMQLVRNDEWSCFYVQILSRSLDARLIVCECLAYDNIEQLKLHSEKCIQMETAEKTVIFRPKICKDVELEVGNLICIYFPWIEVQVNEGEEIVLCTYFSHITL